MGALPKRWNRAKKRNTASKAQEATFLGKKQDSGSIFEDGFLFDNNDQRAEYSYTIISAFYNVRIHAS